MPLIIGLYVIHLYATNYWFVCDPFVCHLLLIISCFYVFYCYFISPYAYLLFTLKFIFTYFRYYKFMLLHINTYQCKNPIVPEEGWFGQPKYSRPSKIVLHCVGFCFYTFFTYYWFVYDAFVSH